MSKATAKTEIQTKQRLIATAFSLFIQKGYENTSIQSIIDAVDIAKGTFYHHFASKEDLLVAMVDGMTDQILTSIRPVVERSDLNARQRLIALLQSAGGTKMDHLAEGMVLVRLMRTGANQKLRQSIQQATNRAVAPIFERLVREGRDDGSFKIGMVEETVALMMALMFGIQDRVIDLTVSLADGDGSAIDGLVRLQRAYEIAMARMLGIGDEDLIIYEGHELRKQLSQIRTIDNKEQGGKGAPLRRVTVNGREQ